VTSPETVVSRMPLPGEPLRFARNTRTLTVHIVTHAPEPGEPGAVVREYASFAEGLADMFTTPCHMLCGRRLLVGAFDSYPAVWMAGSEFADDDLCIACVRALGEQSWRAFHSDERGEPDDQPVT